MKTRKVFNLLLFVCLIVFSNILNAQQTNEKTDQLFDAIQAGEKEKVKALLEKDKTLLEAKNDRGSTALIVAASVGKTEMVKLLVNNGADVKAMNDFLNTPLHYAALSGDVESFILLENKGADLEATNNRGAYPRDYAVQSGNLELFKYIEKKGLDIEKRGSNGATLLHNAAHSGNHEIFKYLADKGMDVNATDNDGDNVLVWASSGGNVDIIKYLVEERKMDFNKAGNTGNKPMHSAVGWGRLEATKYYLEKGVDINEKLESNRIWLHYAVNNARSSEVVKLLIEKGADVNTVDDNGNTPLVWAVGSGSLENVKLLVENGAKLNRKICGRTGCADNGHTPMHSAAWHQPEILKYLLEKGGDVNAKTLDNETILHVAVKGQSPDNVKLLLEKGVDVNVKDNRGNTALHFASLKGKEEFVKMLINKGADVNLEDNEGKTPLHLASIGGYSNIALYLIRNKAEINYKDINGNTPFYFASYYGHKNIAKSLIEAGADKENKPKVKYCFDNVQNEGEATIWYSAHSGWVVKTKNHLLVFDYWQMDAEPENPCVNNGWINPEEIKDQKVIVFSSHTHRDHFDQRIFDWKDKIDNITYVFGFEGQYPVDYEFVAPNQQKDIGDIKLTTIKSNDSGEGFIVEVDGVKILHPGDHANKNTNMTDDYKKEIDYLASKYNEVDVAFFPISGCGFQNKEAVYGGVYYGIEKLNPKVVVPMHGYSREYQYKEFADEAKKKNLPVKYFCASHKGDRFFYKNGNILAAAEY